MNFVDMTVPIGPVVSRRCQSRAAALRLARSADRHPHLAVPRVITTNIRRSHDGHTGDTSRSRAALTVGPVEGVRMAAVRIGAVRRPRADSSSGTPEGLLCESAIVGQVVLA